MEGGGVWGKRGTMDGLANVLQGGQNDQERFTKMEGVVREVREEDITIKIKSREIREWDHAGTFLSTDIQTQRNVKKENVSMDGERVVIDTKRKRIDETMEGEKSGIVIVPTIADQQIPDTKNLQMEGLGIQARQGL